MKPTLLTLEYFLKCAEMQHLTRAAAELRVSQPSLTRTIKSLEKELDVPLFEKRGRNIVLTRYGQILKLHTERILAELSAAEKEIKESRGTVETTVRLSLRSASHLIPGFIIDFQKRYPNIHLEILMEKSEETKDGNSTVDLSLYSTIKPEHTDGSQTLLEEEILLAVPKSDARAGSRTVNLRDFADDPFLLLQIGKSLRTITDVYCHEAGFTPKISLESDNPQTIRAFIRAGFGISFVPKITWYGMQNEAIALIPIADPICRRCLILSWQDNVEENPGAVLLRDYFIDHFAPYAYGKMRT